MTADPEVVAGLAEALARPEAAALVSRLPGEAGAALRALAEADDEADRRQRLEAALGDDEAAVRERAAAWLAAVVELQGELEEAGQTTDAAEAALDLADGLRGRLADLVATLGGTSDAWRAATVVRAALAGVGERLGEGPLREALASAGAAMEEVGAVVRAARRSRSRGEALEGLQRSVERLEALAARLEAEEPFGALVALRPVLDAVAAAAAERPAAQRARILLLRAVLAELEVIVEGRDPVESEGPWAEALAVAEVAGDPEVARYAVDRLRAACLDDADWAGASELSERLALVEGRGGSWPAYAAEMAAAVGLGVRAADLERADALAARLLEDSAATPGAVERGLALLSRMRVDDAAGRTAQVLTHGEELAALRGDGTTRLTASQAEGSYLAASSLVQERRPAEALEKLARARELARWAGQGALYDRATAATIELLAAADRRAEAVELLVEARNAAVQRNGPAPAAPWRNLAAALEQRWGTPAWERELEALRARRRR